MLSESLLYDPHFNSISIEAQNLFVRMLIKTDDYGILPADQWTMFNLSTKTLNSLEKLIGEIESAGLVKLFQYEEKPFIAFKRDRFDEYQSYLIQKRTKSEYLRLTKDVMESSHLEEILGNSWKFQKVTPVTHRKYKVESNKYKDKDIEETISFKDGKLTIPNHLKEEFYATFSRQRVDSEIPAMEKWLKFNKPKKDYKRFIFNWLNKPVQGNTVIKADPPMVRK
ncbi:hypothetical protein, partial [Shewanella sp.]|uniref:hypothetical protein n=1 Tax=Shewanella sp. TaxID=50422 RepID=UPI00356944A2